MIKHPGRWIIALLITMIVAIWPLERALDEAVFTRALWVIYVAAPVATMLSMERRRGARPGGLSIITTLVAAAVFAWIMLGLDARWWVKGMLLLVLASLLMSIANARYRADLLRAQERRDDHATRLAQAVRADEPVERFALYLRPFVSTDRLMTIGVAETK